MAYGSAEAVQGELSFLSRHHARFRSGGIFGTIRQGRRVPASLELPLVDANTRERLGKAEILEVRWLKLVEIDQPSIMRFEFTQSPAELASSLRRLYPTLQDDSWVTFIRFRMVDD